MKRGYPEDLALSLGFEGHEQASHILSTLDRIKINQGDSCLVL